MTKTQVREQRVAVGRIGRRGGRKIHGHGDSSLEGVQLGRIAFEARGDFLAAEFGLQPRQMGELAAEVAWNGFVQCDLCQDTR